MKMLAWLFVTFNNVKFSFLVLFAKSEIHKIIKYLKTLYILSQSVVINSKKSKLSSKHPDPMGKQCRTWITSLLVCTTQNNLNMQLDIFAVKVDRVNILA